MIIGCQRRLCLGPTVIGWGVRSVGLGSAAVCSAFSINHQTMIGWCGWGPRTDAAECDTHFYVLSALGNIFHMTTSVVGVIDTVLYRVAVD